MKLELDNHAERPGIGILTMQQGDGFRGNRQNFLDLVRTGRQMGVEVVVVTPRDLNPALKRILCYSYNETTGKWEPKLLPLPKVIYNRIPTRNDEMQPDVQGTIQSVLRDSRIELFNPTFFNKWTLFEWLGNAKSTSHYIPVTKRLSSLAELGALLRQHAVIYLKPVRSKAGKGIMKIEREQIKSPPRTEYWLSIQDKRSSLTSKYANLESVWNKIRDTIDDEEYILQQGIPLSSYRKRPFDLRVLVQKNGKGVWDVSGIGARVAGRSSITTHVPRGGSIDDPERLLASAFNPSKAKLLLDRVRNAALAIARQIEKKNPDTRSAR